MEEVANESPSEQLSVEKAIELIEVDGGAKGNIKETSPNDGQAGGCGCNFGTGMPFSLFWLSLLVVSLLRRRRK